MKVTDLRGSKGSGPVRRAPIRVRLVTGPVGRLVGFWLDFAAALRQARRQGSED